MYICGQCRKQFSNSGNLKRHVNKQRQCVPEEDKYKCETCGKKFASCSNLYRHKSTVHQKRSVAESEHQLTLVDASDYSLVTDPDNSHLKTLHHSGSQNESTRDGDSGHDSPRIKHTSSPDYVEIAETQALDNPHIVNESRYFLFGGKKIRKTSESPPRVAVYDLIAAMTGQDTKAAFNIYSRLQNAHPEVSTICRNLKMSGKGMKQTPVTDAKGAVVIMNLLPGHQAAKFRMACADVIVRYLGGDETLIQEIERNQEAQQAADESNPFQFFGDKLQPHEFQATSSLKLKSVTEVFDMRAPQLYMRQIFGKWHKVHPVGRPDEVLSADTLAQYAVVKTGSQGESTGRQLIHATAFADSRVIDSCLTDAYTRVEQKSKDTFMKNGQLYEGLHEGKTVRDTELLLVKTQEEYEQRLGVILKFCEITDSSLELRLAQEKTKQVMADAEARKAEAGVRQKELELELLKLQLETRIRA